MATVSFTTTFDLTLSPPQIKLADTTDWAGQGISTSDVNGCFTITAPSGTIIWNNTDYDDGDCDINIATSLINQTVISLPLGADSLPEIGVYTIEYRVKNSSTLDIYTDTNTYDNVYEAVTISLTYAIDCIAPSFRVTDSTSYAVDGTVPSLSGTLTLNYPVGSGLSASTQAISGTGAFILRGKEQFANGTQTGQVSVTATYTFEDGLIVKDLLTGVKEVVVDCTMICSVYCGLRTLEQTMEAQRISNSTEYETTKALFSQIMGIVGLAELAYYCGKSTDSNGYMVLAKTLGNFTDDCSCGSSNASLVSGSGGYISVTIVQSGGAPITVTSSVVGNTTTYAATPFM